MRTRLIAGCLVIALWPGCDCTMPNPALCHGPEDCPGQVCDPVLLTCTDVDAAPREDYIAFVSRRDGNDEIYRMKADGSEQTNLTMDLGSDTTPVWDPTGERIVFLSDRDGLIQLFVMNLDGTNVVRVSGGEATLPAWSRDGQVLAFTSTRTGGAEVFRVNVDGSMLRQLTTTGGIGADWSPDGRLVFVAPDGLSAMEGDGTGQILIATTSEVPLPVTPRWKPDGTRIATHTRFGTSVFVVDADGSNPTNITNPPNLSQERPRWSPVRNEVVVTDSVTPGFDVWVLDASGSATRNVSMTPDDLERLPDWTPDGDAVVFSSDRGGNTDIYEVTREGGAATNLTNNASEDTEPRCRPRP